MNLWKRENCILLQHTSTGREIFENVSMLPDVTLPLVVLLTDKSPQVAKLSASDIRPCIYLTSSRGRGAGERVVARNGICVAPGRSRPTAVRTPPSPGSRALIISVHPAPLLGGGRRAPFTHASVSSRASRFRRGGHAAGVVPRDPRHTLPTRPAGSITREEAPSTSPEYVASAPGKVSGSSCFQFPSVRRRQFIYRKK